jgi:hypothetical protein
MSMSMYLGIGPVVALIAGILILIMPRLLNYIVAIYLIVTGLIGLAGNHSMRRGTSVMISSPASIQRTAEKAPLRSKLPALSSEETPARRAAL